MPADSQAWTSDTLARSSLALVIGVALRVGAAFGREIGRDGKSPAHRLEEVHREPPSSLPRKIPPTLLIPRNHLIPGNTAALTAPAVKVEGR